MALAPHSVVGRASSALRYPLTVGIRREDPQRIWERRAPLTPNAVYDLQAKQNVRVIIEPCDRRVFPTSEYVKAGAEVKDDLEDAHIHVGIKETPLQRLISSPAIKPQAALKATTPKVEHCARTHLMFSHTAKGQTYNTPLLSRYLEDKTRPAENFLPRLIDYELLTDEKDGKRTVGFGWFAGVAGVLESLSAMAVSHLEIGIASPFLYTPRPHTLPSLERLRSALRDIGKRISTEGTPAKLGPFVIGLTGTGNVSQGCLSMLSELPICKISVQDLHGLVTNKDADLKQVYLVHAKSDDYLVGLDGRKYNRDDYYKHPQNYRSTFCDTVAPYLTLFLNGTGWAPTFPRLMTNEQLTIALDRAQVLGGARFTNIGDISCDVEGGLEFLARSSTLCSPYYKIRPSTLPSHLPSVQMMAVDILPASIPLDASQHFSKALAPYLRSLIDTYVSPDTSSARSSIRALETATIAVNGKLVEKHEWLQGAVDRWRTDNVRMVSSDSSGPLANKAVSTAEEALINPSPPLRKKRILMLGSGMVAGPAVDEIAKRADVQLVIASNSAAEVEKMSRNHLNVQCQVIDMANQRTFSHLIEEADVVISLLPVALHVDAAKLCIQYRKHLVTASYISDAMRGLHEQAVDADVLLLNEIGLDPGIDHCSAISLISQLRAQNKNIVSFTSFCGGLPAPDVPIVPLRYKFSWSPRGVLTAALNMAKYKLNGSVTTIPGVDLLTRKFPNVPITDQFDLEGIANRDSLIYADTYNFGHSESMRTLLRGTLRYPGFSDLMQSFKSIGFLETDEKIVLERWSTFVQQSLALRFKNKVPPREALSMISSLIPLRHIASFHEALEWLSLVPSTAIGFTPSPMPPLPTGPMAPLDIFAYLLSHKLRYLPNERDMVVLSHEIITKGQGEGAPEEVHTSSMITYGTPTASAMARTVGLPVAFAALNVLDGKVAIRGVAGPDDPSIYKPVLQGLEELGLGMKETVTLSTGRTTTVETRLIQSVGEEQPALKVETAEQKAAELSVV